MKKRKSHRPKQVSDGIIHARITLALVPVAAGLCALIPLYIPLFVPVAGVPESAVEIALRSGLGALGCLCGIPMSPDLDQESATTAEWVWFKIPVIGWLFGFVWQIVWYPYAYFLSHRSVWSHGILIGTLIRVVYLGFIVSVVLLINGQGTILDHIRLEVLAMWFLGLLISDVGHYARDYFGVGG